MSDEYPELKDCPVVELPPGPLQQAINQALAARAELDRQAELEAQAGQLNALRAQQAKQQQRQAARHYLGETLQEVKAQLADLPERRQAWLTKVQAAAKLIAEARAEQDELQKVISSSGYRLLDACNALNAAGVDPADYADYDPTSPTKAGPMLADFADYWHQAGGDDSRLVMALAVLMLNAPELREVGALLQPQKGQKFYTGLKYFY